MVYELHIYTIVLSVYHRGRATTTLCFAGLHFVASLRFRQNGSVAEERAEPYNEVMGNNPVLRSQITQPQVASDDTSLKIKAVHERFFSELGKITKEHREKINVILRTIDERKIKDLKEKLKNI